VEPDGPLPTHIGVSALEDVRSGPTPQSAEGFDAFFSREYPRAVKLAWLLTRSAAAAEDIAQEAMIGVHRRFAALDSPAAYLTRVVVNRCRGWHRRGTAELRVVRTLSAAAERLVDPADEYLLDAIHSSTTVCSPRGGQATTATQLSSARTTAPGACSARSTN
jgi:DNA-directed RNA polymerase specialized sigma24 family protein